MEKKKTLTITVAYLVVILIWSTTPLTIKWSGEGVGYLFGITGRMIIGAVLALLLTLIWYKKLPLHNKALQVYWASSVAIYGGMLPVYWGAQYISSGIISVVFGLTPIFTAYMAARLLNEDSLSIAKLWGALLGVLGLAVIFSEQLVLGDDAFWGISAVLLSVVLHSISAVWIKRLNAKVPALAVTSGGLVFSLPLFLATFLIFSSTVPNELPTKAIWSILYLGVMGSVVGFVSYYYLLSNIRASSVALITLITPVSALLLGNLFNQESISSYVWFGTAFVLCGLILHQWGYLLSKSLCREK